MWMCGGAFSNNHQDFKTQMPGNLKARSRFLKPKYIGVHGLSGPRFFRLASKSIWQPCGPLKQQVNAFHGHPVCQFQTRWCLIPTHAHNLRMSPPKISHFMAFQKSWYVGWCQIYVVITWSPTQYNSSFIILHAHGVPGFDHFPTDSRKQSCGTINIERRSNGNREIAGR